MEGVRADLFQDLPHEQGELEEFLSAFKTAMMLKDWMDEVPEDEIAQTYSIGPGDIRNKVETAEWLIHSAAEIAKLYNKQKADLLKKLTKRVKHGIKEELFPLMKMEQIGRVRARELYEAGYQKPKEVENATKRELEQISGIGDKIASKVSEKEETKGKIKKDKNIEEDEYSNQSSLTDF